MLVPGWYDEVVPLTVKERAAIAGIPGESPRDYGFAVPEGGPGARRLERIALPSLDVRGQVSHAVGQAPDSATRALSPHRPHPLPRGRLPRPRLPFDHPVGRRPHPRRPPRLRGAPTLMPTMGGSVPAVWFPVVTGTEAILLPLVNPDNLQHAENENLRLVNSFPGSESSRRS